MSRRALAVVLAVLLSVGCAAFERTTVDWWQASRAPSGQAPDPALTPEAVVQVYAARTVGWRGVFGVHTWVTVKRQGAAAYRRYEVIGWGVDRGAPAVRVDRTGPDNHWFGARPERLVDVRGDGVEALITKIEAAVAAYPYASAYRTWPGPNSNTFVAHVGRAVPELRLVLPPTAVGKDFLPGGVLVAPSPAGRGLQLSLLGVAGVLAGWDEGLEINVLGLSFGIDVKAPALKLPVAGRLGVRPASDGGR
ncbi:MAG TPA: DUF3750 domain-containing protein [Candidatus Limnocylindria bacterium]|nr:DUF3750 domain-containing protein [Candidatus Limnocylindria bacterium]